MQLCVLARLCTAKKQTQGCGPCVELTRRAPKVFVAAKPLGSRLGGSPVHLWHGFALALVFKMPTPEATRSLGSAIR